MIAAAKAAIEADNAGPVGADDIARAMCLAEEVGLKCHNPSDSADSYNYSARSQWQDNSEKIK